MRAYLKILGVVVLLLLLYSCMHRVHHKKVANNETIFVVRPHALATTLYYAGIIEPFHAVVVTTPAEGVIADMRFHIGDVVKKGDWLFSISSEKFSTDYKSALMQYIKAKTEFINSQAQWKENEFLHQNQLISEDDFKAKKISYYNTRLALLQARETLENMLKRLDTTGINVENLKIEDIDQINQILHAQENTQHLRIISPADGVALLPNKSSTESDLKKIAQGEEVKQNDVLALISNTQSLIVRINVNEFNINQLKVGQKVHVTGAAFPEEVLVGEIAALDHQGHPSSNGGLPVFPVEVVVLHLTAAQQKIIHMGMSAKVAIQVGDGAPLTVPLRAVFQKEQQSFVKIRDQKTKMTREVLVKTGQTTLDAVVIESGLAAGDQVIVTH